MEIMMIVSLRIQYFQTSHKFIQFTRNITCTCKDEDKSTFEDYFSNDKPNYKRNLSHPNKFKKFKKAE